MKISEMLEREANRDAALERELAERGITIGGNAGIDQAGDPSLRGEQKGHVVKTSLRLSETVAGRRGCRF